MSQLKNKFIQKLRDDVNYLFLNFNVCKVNYTSAQYTSSLNKSSRKLEYRSIGD